METASFEGKTDYEEIFRRIDASDIIYIVAEEGYVGPTVALEIAYAYSKGKTIIASEPIRRRDINLLVSQIMSPEKLIRFVIEYEVSAQPGSLASAQAPNISPPRF